VKGAEIHIERERGPSPGGGITHLIKNDRGEREKEEPTVNGETDGGGGVKSGGN